LINRGSSGVDVNLKAGDLGLLDVNKAVRDVWQQANVADFTSDLAQRVEAHQTLLLKINS
jgi:hypothetical protein